MDAIKLSISKSEAGRRIDKFLAGKLASCQSAGGRISRALIKRRINAGQITVNRKTVEPKYLLKAGDLIRGELAADVEERISPDPSIKIDVVYEDEDFLVLNKPAGLLTHPTPVQRAGTLVNGLLAYVPQIKDVGDHPACSGQENLRPGIVHRLDRETSGLMIAAKKQKTFDFFKKAFQEHEIEKRYLALVYGRPAKDEGEIMLPIGKSKNLGRQTTGFKGKKIRFALTEFKVLKQFEKYSLVDVFPKTGRTHQIRVHLASLGHPIVGDKIYGGKRFSEEAAAGRPVDRQFLHAYFLRFAAPGGKIMQFQIELPPDLKGCLASLEKTAGS